MATKEDKQRIAKHLLLSSLPGHFNLILSDLQTILNTSTSDDDSLTLSPDWITSIREEYESKTGKYILSAKELHSSSANDGHDIQGLEEKLRDHLSKYYSLKGVTSNIVVQADESSTYGTIYTILLYAERIQLQHFHSGSWTSQYTVDLTNSKFLHGKSVIHAHTFEDGNVQMTYKLDGPMSNTHPNTKLSSSAPTVEQIIVQIEQWEDDALQPLEHMYESMNDGILKHMRRIMPVTRTKFDWTVANHKFVKTIGLDMKSKK